jgi:hypothetical protein
MTLDTIRIWLQIGAALIGIFVFINQIYVRRRLVKRNLSEWKDKIKSIADSEKTKRFGLWILLTMQVFMATASVLAVALLLSFDALPRPYVIAVVIFSASFFYWLNEIITDWTKL